MSYFNERYLREKINEIRLIFSDRNIERFNENELRWIKSINEVVSSKTYMSSNVDDLLWFWENGLNKCKSIMDFGCGSGYLTHILSLMGKNVVGYEYIGNWVGQDIPAREYKNVFEYCHGLLRDRNKNLGFKFYNSLPLDVKSSSIDGVVMYAVLEHLEQSVLDQTLKEIRRILKKDGLLFIGKLPRKYSYQEWLSRLIGLKSHENLFTKRQISELFNEYGFEIQKIESTGLFFNHPNKITNCLYPITKIEKFLRFLPILHDYRLVLK